jgi:adenosylhomocysteine nucleosidase
MTDSPVVILTALDLEYNAVRKHLTNPRPYKNIADTQFEMGRAAGCQVLLALAGRGNQTVAVIGERSINAFSPAAILFSGIAGGIQPHLRLGDVVIATYVYPYHGATSTDDGLQARPRALEIQHGADQLAHRVARADTWQALTTASRRNRPTARFGPIAAGEVVHYSGTSEQLKWLRQHYSDAVAVETEGAGVAQAAHLNRSLPVVVIRGISDLADSSKEITDQAGWQAKAAANAAAFTIALAKELAPLGRDSRSATREETPMRMTNKNVATNSTVGIQGQIISNARVNLSASGSDIHEQITALGANLRTAHEQGQLDDELYEAAETELGTAGAAAKEGPSARRRLVVALKRLSGLVTGVTDLSANVAALISFAESRP